MPNIGVVIIFFNGFVENGAKDYASDDDDPKEYFKEEVYHIFKYLVVTKLDKKILSGNEQAGKVWHKCRE